MWFKYGLKAQKLLAQGIALGIMAISKAPCKGKSFVYCQVFESFCPYRATGLRPKKPRAMPWARSFCPFRACGAYLRNLNNLLIINSKFSYFTTARVKAEQEAAIARQKAEEAERVSQQEINEP
jgi:hypothetical protein